jgi:hypothetical protein
MFIFFLSRRITACLFEIPKLEIYSLTFHLDFDGDIVKGYGFVVFRELILGVTDSWGSYRERNNVFCESASPTTTSLIGMELIIKLII